MSRANKENNCDDAKQHKEIHDVKSLESQLMLQEAVFPNVSVYVVVLMMMLMMTGGYGDGDGFLYLKKETKPRLDYVTVTTFETYGI